MGRFTLGVDVGTQSTKAILYDVRAKTVAARGVYAYDLLERASPNAAEQDPSTWIEGIKASVAQALAAVPGGATKEDIMGVSVSGQQHGLVAIDADGQVVRPAKLWCDTESAPEAEELGAVFGWNMQAGFTASKALWLKRHEPDNWERTETILLPHDWVNYVLTGVKAMEAGDASGIGTMDLGRRCWDAELCAAVDDRMTSMLPPLLPPDSKIGEVTPAAAAALGLPAGVPVALGSGDNMMSALGAGCVAEGRLVISLGTSGTLFGYSASPVRDPTGAVAPFCDSTGGYLPLLCTMNCTQVVSEVVAMFGGPEAGAGHDELAAEAVKHSKPGCGGVRFLPYLVGERSPNWPHASGALTGLRPGTLTQRGVLYRAALEGATYSLLSGVRRMSELGLPPPTHLSVVGGGSKSAVWRQTIADAFGVPVRRLLEPESAALGAAMQAAAMLEAVPTREYVLRHPPPYADGEERPDAAAAKAHAENYEAFVAEGKALFDRRRDGVSRTEQCG